MPPPLFPTPKEVALVTLDYQPAIFKLAGESGDYLEHSASIVAHARQRGFKIYHVGTAFEEGYPELQGVTNDDESGDGEGGWAGWEIWRRIRESGNFVHGQEGTGICGEIRGEGEVVFWKTRASAFIGRREPYLLGTLKQQGIRHLILIGLATSGAVLSTLRSAYDLDFKVTVVREGCWDHDEETQRVLLEKIFPKQARVVTMADFVQDR